MKNKDYTEILFIVDNSSSMKKIKESAEYGLRNILSEQRSMPGTCKVSVINFATNVNIQDVGRDIGVFWNISINPNGWTALNDAIGDGINLLGKRLSDMSPQNRPNHVIVVIVTDGEENRSQRFSHNTIVDMIKHQQSKYSWEFLYVGVGKDAFNTAKEYGISEDNMMAYTHDSDGTQAYTKGLSAKMSAIRSNQAYKMSSHSNV